MCCAAPKAMERAGARFVLVRSRRSLLQHLARGGGLRHGGLAVSRSHRPYQELGLLGIAGNRAAQAIGFPRQSVDRFFTNGVTESWPVEQPQRGLNFAPMLKAGSSSAGYDESGPIRRLAETAARDVAKGVFFQFQP
jgi:hypothetical protein